MQSKARARTSIFALAFCLGWGVLALPSGIGGAWAQTSTQYLEDPRIKAQRFYDHGQFKECFEFVEPLVLGPEKKNASLQFLYAELLKKYGKKDEAIAHFEEVLKLVPAGGMQKLAQDNVRELRGPTAIQSSARFGGRRGYTGLKIYNNLVRTVFPSSPAALAGIAAGDKIISVDGASTVGLSVDDISKRIMGLEGTKVVLVVERGGNQYSASIIRSAPVESEYDALNGRKTLSAAQSRNLELPRSLVPAVKPPDRQSQTSAQSPDSGVSSPPLPIEFLRRTADSDTMKKEVEVSLKRISPSLKSTVASAGIKIVITPTILDALPELAQERPSGYLHGGSYSNCSGLFRSSVKTIFVAEKVSAGSHVPQLNFQMQSTFFHEFGHAVDHCQRISSSEAFMADYQKDSSRIPNGVKNEFYYFTQNGSAGPSELFAELFACAMLAGDGLDTKSTNLTRAFPNCFDQVKKLTL